MVGRRLLGSVSAGEPLTAERVLDRDALRDLPPTLAAVAVPLADRHSIDLVRPGDRIDLLATPRPDDAIDEPGRASVRILARSARALAVFGEGTDGGAEIVLAVPRDVGATVARTNATDVFTVVVVPP